MEYCKKHPRTKLITETFGCEYCDFCRAYCPKCEKEEERKNDIALRKTTNIVVKKEEWIIEKKKIVSRHSIGRGASFNIPHGGKPLKKGSYCSINSKGFLEHDSSGEFFVIK